MEYKLSDSAIAQIAQLVQLGILTGTDITDHLRTLRLDVKEKTNMLVPSVSFEKDFNENLKKLVTQAEAANTLTEE
jgi:hypothetical protein